MSSGYYSDGGTTWNPKLATSIPVTDSDVSGKNLSLIKGNKIVGTVSIPEGYSKATVNVGADVLTSDGAWVGLGLFNFIELDPAYSKAFTLIIPSEVTNCRILYTCSDANTLATYVSRGYYSVNGTVSDPNLATVISMPSQGDINLKVVPGIQISGTVCGNYSNYYGNVFVYASKKGIDGSWYTVSSQNVYLSYYSPGQFTLCVPQNDEYRISYSISSASDNFPYVTKGYYSKGETIADSNKATMLAVKNSSIKYVDLNMIPGYKVSGTIQLPSGMVAPKGGLPVSVYAEKETADGTGDWTVIGSATAIISEGDNSVKYTGFVDQSAVNNDSNRFRMYYSISKNNYAANDLVLKGYLGANGTVGFSSDAINVFTDISKSYTKDFTIIPGTAIKGVVSLPSGNTAYAGGIKVDMYFGKIIDGGNEWSGEGNTSCVVPQGSNSVEYTIIVPIDQPAGGYKVWARYDNAAADYLQRSFYTAEGSVPFISMGDLVDISGGSRADINITLLPYSDCSFNAVFQANGITVNTIAGNQNKLMDVSGEMKWNNTETKDVLLVVALYNSDGAMVDIAYVSKKVNMGDTNTLHAGFKLPSDVAGYTVNAFVLDGTNISTSSLQPLSNVLQLK